MFPMLEMLTGERPRISDRMTESEYAAFLDNMQNMCSFDISRMIEQITPAEFTLMYIIALPNKSGCPMTVAKAAEQLHVSVPAVSRTLKNLENKGYVTRSVNQHDRRSVNIILSDDGTELLISNLRRFEDTMERILSHFTDDELHTMMQLQSKFIQAAADEMSDAR